MRERDVTKILRDRGQYADLIQRVGVSYGTAGWGHVTDLEKTSRVHQSILTEQQYQIQTLRQLWR